MYSLFIGYALFYFCRKNLSVALPVLAKELHYNNTQLGILGASLYVTYGIGKFASGVLGDHSNARLMMVTGVVLSAVMNVLFGMSSSLGALTAFWALNGLFQSLGVPPCARLLANWYSVSERGVMWGIWNVSHQVGAAAVAAFTGVLISHAGWRAAFFVPAALCMATGIFLWERLRDTPTSMGLPSVDEYRNEHEFDLKGHKTSDDPESISNVVWGRVLNNPYIWLLGFVNLLVYVVRTSVFDWAAKYMVEVKGSTLARAGITTAVLELVGIVGALLAGVLSDRLDGGRRGPTCLAFFALTPVGLITFYLNPPGNFTLDAVALGAVGLCIYAPQFLVSVFAADLATRKGAATAIGFVGAFGYAGAALSGVGTGLLVDRFGWRGGFMYWLGATLLGTLLTAALFNVHPRRRSLPRA